MEFFPKLRDKHLVSSCYRKHMPPLIGNSSSLTPKLRFFPDVFKRWFYSVDLAHMPL